MPQWRIIVYGYRPAWLNGWVLTTGVDLQPGETFEAMKQNFEGLRCQRVFLARRGYITASQQADTTSTKHQQEHTQGWARALILLQGFAIPALVCPETVSCKASRSSVPTDSRCGAARCRRKSQCWRTSAGRAWKSTEMPSGTSRT